MKKSLLFITIFFFSLLRSSQSQNLVVNGDFETGDKTGWNNWNNAIESNDVYEGAFSGRLKPNKAGSFQQVITLIPGHTYTASFAAKWPDGIGATQGIQLQFSDNADNNRIGETGLITSADWSVMNGELTVPPGINDVKLACWKINSPICLVDNISLIDLGPIKPAVSVKSDGEIIEGTEEGMFINVVLLNDNFSDNLNIANWSFDIFPEGISIGEIERVSADTARIILQGNAAEDYDMDITSYLTIGADEFANYTEDITSKMKVVFTAIDEPNPTLKLESDGEILEDFEDGEKITVTLYLDVFVDQVNQDAWSFMNLPEGVEMGTIERTSDTTVVISLVNNTTGDYDQDITDASLTVSASEFVTWNEPIMVNTGIVFIATNEGGEEVLWEDDFNSYQNGINLLDSINRELYGFSAWGAPDSAIVTDGYVIMYGSGADGNNNWFQYVSDTLYPGTSYKFSADIKTPDAKKAFVVVLQAVENDQFKGNVIESGDWQSSSTYFTVDAIKDSVLCSVYRWGVKQVHLDNMKLVKLTEPAITISDNGDLVEGSEDGKIITVTLSNDTFLETLSLDNWTLTNLPVGVSLASVTRINDTSVELMLSGNATEDYDENITDVKLVVSRYEFFTSNKNLVVEEGITFQAVVELPYITMSDDGEIKEGAEDGEEIQVKLYLDTFVDPLNPANWSLTGRPAGVSIGEIFRVDDTTVDIVLSGNATEDYDEDISPVLTIKADECVLSELDLTVETGATFIAVIESGSIEIEDKSLIVYPNPVSGLLQVESQNQIVSIEVFRLNGKVIDYKNNVNKQKTKLLTSHWEKGVFLIQIIDTKGNLSLVKVVK